MSFIAFFKRLFSFILLLNGCLLLSPSYAYFGSFGNYELIDLRDARFQLSHHAPLSPLGFHSHPSKYSVFMDSEDLNSKLVSNLSFVNSAFANPPKDSIPDPRMVMRRSMVLPGWGQYTNRQFWKIPLVYGLIGGLSYYAYFSHTRFSGYRTAFYNVQPENTDFRFGATPSWIDPNAPPQFYRTSRDFYRNRRDFFIVTVAFAYILNFVDAYVYAHMRDFDVSDDLASRVSITPEPLLAQKTYPGLRLNIRL